MVRLVIDFKFQLDSLNACLVSKSKNEDQERVIHVAHNQDVGHDFVQLEMSFLQHQKDLIINPTNPPRTRGQIEARL